MLGLTEGDGLEEVEGRFAGLTVSLRRGPFALVSMMVTMMYTCVYDVYCICILYIYIYCGRAN